MPPRLYCPVPLRSGAELTLPAHAARHAQVLRLQPGDAVELFHGGLPQATAFADTNPAFAAADEATRAAAQPAWATGWFEATITRMGRSEVSARIGNWHGPASQSQAAVHIACGVPANERMDWLVEKAAELGAASIQPLLTRRSVLRLSGERAAKRVAHWQAVAISACEQSGRTAVPWVRPMLPLEAFLQPPAAVPQAEAEEPSPMRWLLSLQAGAQAFAAALQRLPDGRPLYLLSGPEGGLDPAEEAQAVQQGWLPVSLGACTLRAETAPIAALAAWGICCRVQCPSGAMDQA